MSRTWSTDLLDLSMKPQKEGKYLDCIKIGIGYHGNFWSR